MIVTMMGRRRVGGSDGGVIDQVVMVWWELLLDHCSHSMTAEEGVARVEVNRKVGRRIGREKAKREGRSWWRRGEKSEGVKDEEKQQLHQ